VTPEAKNFVVYGHYRQKNAAIIAANAAQWQGWVKICKKTCAIGTNLARARQNRTDHHPVLVRLKKSQNQ
jgi:hypothetical protein